uniref:Uncharacterized protein n=1 Tax=Staphylococcus phage HS06 TaxID=3056400 RepID=A0AA49X448_9VIRU|nr:MAG: hypothetical protein [Staphylococcus phage HS06]
MLAIILFLSLFIGHRLLISYYTKNSYQSKVFYEKNVFCVDNTKKTYYISVTERR